MTNKLTGGTLVPAYGRDYKSRAEVVLALNSGADFTIQTYNGSGYVSITDLDGQFQARDKSLRKLWVIKIADGIAK